MSSHIRLGINPLSWMNSDLPELGADIPLEQCLSEAALCGYRGIEAEDRFRENPALTNQQLALRDLSCVGGWHSTFILEKGIEFALEELEQHLTLLQKLGGEVVVLAECSGAIHRDRSKGLSERPQLREDQWDELCSGLDALATQVQKAGLVSAYHHHMGTVVQSALDIEQLMNGTEKLGLLYDTGHLSYAEADLKEVLEKHINRITHVHCKEVRKETLANNLASDTPFLSAVIDGAFTVPGDSEGETDFRHPIQILVANHYCGWIVVEAEQDPNIANPLQYAKLGHDTLQGILTQEKFRVETTLQKTK